MVARLDTPRRALRVREVAEQLGVSDKVVRGWIARGQLKASRPSPRLYLVQLRHLDDFLEGTAVDAGGPAVPRLHHTRRVPTPRGIS